MAGKIERYDLITKEAIDELTKVLTKFESLIKSATELSKALKGSGGGLNENAKYTKKLSDTVSEYQAILKETESQLKKFNSEQAKNKLATSEVNKETIKNNIARKNKESAIKEEITGEKALARAIKEESDAKKENAKLLKQEEKNRADAAKAIGKQSEEIKKLNSYFRELEKESDKAIANQKRLNKEQSANKIALNAQRTKAYNEELKKQATMQKLLIVAKNTEAGSLSRLNAVNNIYKQRMKELNVLIPAQAKQYANLNARINENNARIAKLKQANGGLLTTFKGLLKSVGAYALAYIGLQQIVGFFTRTLFNLVKEFSSLNFAIKNIIKDSSELAVTQSFLNKVSANYGQDIVSLTQRYIKFRAASLQSNITSKQTMQIFDSLAKASGVLGLRTDEVNTVFLALEQMMSKGKVTTEELRRQLGERLPGAMGIMADAVGVSISELDKMMKKGEVISEDVLPEFARQVEIAYGINTVTKIDNVIAAQGRLNTSWKLFVKELKAEKSYKSVINAMSNVFNDFILDTGIATNVLDRYLLMTTKTAKGVQDLVLVLDEMDFKDINNPDATKQFTAAFEEAGLTTERAAKAWQEYYNIRLQTEQLDKNVYKKPIIYDFDTAKKELDQADKDYESLKNIKDNQLKDTFKDTSNALKTGEESYRKYLENIKVMYEDISVDPRIATLLSKSVLDDFEFLAKQHGTLEERLSKTTDLAEQARIRKTYKNETEKNRILLENYENRLAFEVEIANRLAELNKGGGGRKGDSALDLLKAQQALELEMLKTKHKKDILETEQTEDELLQMQYDHSREIIVQKLEDLEEQKAIKNLEKKELLEIEKEYQQLQREVYENATDYKNGTFEKAIKQRKAQDEATIADLYARINEERVIMAEAATEQLQDAGNSNKKRQEINKKLILTQLQFERERLQELVDSGQLLIENEQEISDRILEIKEAEEKTKRDLAQQTRDQQIENLQYIGQAVSNGAQFYNQLLEGQLNKAKELYEGDLAAAGDSAERKYLAEKKYQEEQTKLKRRQAIADKAQALFNIGLELAMAQAELNPFQIAAAILAAATVVATPIPQFATGTEFAPETFFAGEKGAEAIVKKTGETLLTPNKATMFSDKSFIGAKIIPHDETQKLLASQALRQSASIVDMGMTNKFLSSIEKNTKRNKEVFERNGKIVMKRGIVTSYIQ